MVELLMGDVPERSLFNQAELRLALEPYFVVTQAVRCGDLERFSSAFTNYKSVFENDSSFTLMHRLRTNVIKTALRKINISYSRISLKDICMKLKLDNEEDAEYIVAKAIHDGVIEASLDRELKILSSHTTLDIYSTHEPQQQFHKRIQLALQIHNDAVKALQYPEGAFKSQTWEDEDDEDEDGNPRVKFNDQSKDPNNPTKKPNDEEKKGRQKER